VVNNSYLGLIRQSQRGFQMDFEVSLSFENINSEEAGSYGVDHVAVAEGLGCKAVRVKSPNEFKEAFATARKLMKEHQVPVVMEFILERVTNVSMGTEITNVNEFEEILCLDPRLSIDDVSGSVLRTQGDKPAATAQNAAPASAG
jgi:tartronate-semialdehyde synthase